MLPPFFLFFERFSSTSLPASDSEMRASFPRAVLFTAFFLRERSGGFFARQIEHKKEESF